MDLAYKKACFFPTKGFFSSNFRSLATLEDRMSGIHRDGGPGWNQWWSFTEKQYPQLTRGFINLGMLKNGKGPSCKDPQGIHHVPFTTVQRMVPLEAVHEHATSPISTCLYVCTKLGFDQIMKGVPFSLYLPDFILMSHTDVDTLFISIQKPSPGSISYEEWQVMSGLLKAGLMSDCQPKRWSKKNNSSRFKMSNHWEILTPNMLFNTNGEFYHQKHGG